MCRYVNMVRDVAPGVSSVLLVLLIRIVTKDMCYSKFATRDTRNSYINRTYQVYFSYRCYRKKEPLIR